MICYFFPEPKYFFFASDLPELLYYSHIPVAIVALLVGLFVFFNARYLLLSKLLFLISLCFSLWVLASLISWTNIHSDFLLFVWTFFGVLAALISILSIYFVYVFINKADVSFKIKTIFLLLILPVLIFAPSDLSLSGFNLVNCDAFEFEGLAFKIYHTLLGIIAMIWILFLLVRGYRSAEEHVKKQILYMGIGIESFLFLFFTITFLVTYLTSLGFFEDSRLEFFGLFGMMIFMIMIGILIVRFKAFNIGVISSQVLLIALIILTASQFTFITSITNIVLTAITLVLIGVIGIMLMRAVKKEIKQKQEIIDLAGRLKIANNRLRELDKVKSEFVSIASHQLRSPLTSMRGYASMLLEGSYGAFPKKAKEILERIAESSRFMALTVEDFLNVSRIEAGEMKYDYSDFNIKELAEKVVDDTRQVAMQKGLLLVFRSNCTTNCIIHADIGKVHQVLYNLLDNAMKYTPKGSITVVTHDDKKEQKVRVSVIDTGIGMKEKSIDTIFDKFIRAKNANSVNVTGAGLGLFVAKQMVEQMGGHIEVSSEGEGKGSTFTLVFPLVNQKAKK